MKAIMSGASGYIGSNLLDKMIKQGFKVGVIGRSSKLPIESELIDLYKADITKPIKIVPNSDYDTFIHLAAANDVDSLDTQTAILTTVLGTKNCLDLCKEIGIKQFIYFSTFQVYGNVSGIMNEDTLLAPNNDYGITHRFAEEYVEMYSRILGLNYVIIRPTNIYGAPISKHIDRWTLVPNCFCKEAVEKKCITLMSSGKQTRDFINLNDLTSITISIIKMFDKFKNQILNAASGNNFTILEIAEIVREVYKNIFNENCDLNIKSNIPLIANQVNVCNDKIKKVEFNFSSRDSIKQEITKIFNLLQN